MAIDSWSGLAGDLGPSLKKFFGSKQRRSVKMVSSDREAFLSSSLFVVLFCGC
jgi:hypothetical protein